MAKDQKKFDHTQERNEILGEIKVIKGLKYIAQEKKGELIRDLLAKGKEFSSKGVNTSENGLELQKDIIKIPESTLKFFIDKRFFEKHLIECIDKDVLLELWYEDFFQEFMAQQKKDWDIERIPPTLEDINNPDSKLGSGFFAFIELYLETNNIPGFPNLKQIGLLTYRLRDMVGNGLPLEAYSYDENGKSISSYVEIINKLSPEERYLIYINLIHNNKNGHLDEEKELWQHVYSLPNYKELLMTNYADLLGIPKNYQFSVNKEVTVDGEKILLIAEGFFTNNSLSKGKYIVGNKLGKKVFIYDNGMSEHKFIAEKYGIENVLGGGWIAIDKKGLSVFDESKVFGKDPYQETGFSKKVFENLFKN